MNRKDTRVEEQDAEMGNGLKPGYVRDYISGVAVKASPEEVEAVQVFAQRLVEDYSYPPKRTSRRTHSSERENALPTRRKPIPLILRSSEAPRSVKTICI